MPRLLSGVSVKSASWWWLRSPGNNSNNAANVNNDGDINVNGNNVNNDNGVRPASPRPHQPETLLHVERVCAMGQRNRIPSRLKGRENTCRWKRETQATRLFPFSGAGGFGAGSPNGAMERLCTDTRKYAIFKTFTMPTSRRGGASAARPRSSASR
ncbi:MAG: DUF6273 domain-containing protein [Lachnospiraceae bacterium]|nr:DUF6273 domain-containing protein [Lachnospiraceae bacterium]